MGLTISGMLNGYTNKEILHEIFYFILKDLKCLDTIENEIYKQTKENNIEQICIDTPINNDLCKFIKDTLNIQCKSVNDTKRLLPFNSAKLSTYFKEGDTFVRFQYCKELRYVWSYTERDNDEYYILFILEK